MGGKIQLPGQAQGVEVQPVVVYQDENYIVLRVSPIVDMNMKMQIPFGIAQIGAYGITAKEFVPRVGKENFLKSIDVLQDAMKAWFDEQRKEADNMKDTVAPKPKRPTIGDALKAGDDEAKQ